MNEVDMFKQMLLMQDEINSIINPNWKAAKYPWHRAVWIECAELIDHHGYKWWKHQMPEWDQITLEIVDIWHFGLSMLLALDLSVDELAQDITTHYFAVFDNIVPDGFMFVEKVEVFAGTTITGVFDTISFFDMMLAAEVDLDILFSMYVGKNVLNKFRQSNGYKTGTYRKCWYDGREDNEHLTDIMGMTLLKEFTGNSLVEAILNQLQIAYDKKVYIPDSHLVELS